MLSVALDGDIFNELLERPFIMEGEDSSISFVEYIRKLNCCGNDFYEIVAGTMDSGDKVCDTVTKVEAGSLKRFFYALKDVAISDESRKTILIYILSQPVGADGVIFFLSRCELSANDPVLIDIIRHYNTNLYSQETIVDICNSVTKRGVDINYTDQNEECVLSAAIKKGALGIVKWAISSGADIDSPIGEEKLPLQLYVCSEVTSNSLGILKRLDSYGKLNLEEGGMFNITPLMAASRKCAVELVAYLLDRGANVEVREHEGKTTPLIAAISYEANIKTELRVKCVELLLSRGADINGRCSDGITPLMCACSYGALSVVELLIERGADVTLTDERGHNAINYLSIGSWDYEYRKNNSFNEIIRANILKVLVAKGTSIDNVPSGYRCFPAIIDALGYNYPLLFSAFIQCGADINIKDREGKSLLHYAFGYNAPKYVEMIFSNTDADLGVKNGDDSNLWHALSAVKQSDNVIKFAAILKERGVAIEANKFDEHPLHRAVLNDNLVLVNYFIAQDSGSLNCEDDHGRTPIFNLFVNKESGKNKVEICQALIEAGAELNTRSRQGETPLGLSEETNMTAIRELLIKSGADSSMGRKRIGFLH